MSERTIGQKFMAWLGGLMAFGSLPLVILLIHQIFFGGGGLLLGLLIAVTMVLLPAILFLYMGLRKPRERSVQVDAAMERLVLYLAQQNNGELTASTLAMNSRLGLTGAQDVLSQLEVSGFAYSHVETGGSVHYTFPELKTTLGVEDDFMRRLDEEQQEDPRSVLHFHHQKEKK